MNPLPRSDGSHPDYQVILKRLAADVAATSAQIDALKRDFKAIIEANALVAVDDEHDPEGSSTAFERQHVAALITQKRAHLNVLNDALNRLEHGGYGWCSKCGDPIPAERLEARPAATMCVRCAESPAR
jgi:RNA polymerase-binding transcription factor DksA